MAAVLGLGSNSGVGFLDEFLLNHGKARWTTERLVKVESPSLLLLRALGLVVEGLEHMDWLVVEQVVLMY
jgi:hypothetical protein